MMLLAQAHSLHHACGVLGVWLNFRQLGYLGIGQEGIYIVVEA